MYFYKLLKFLGTPLKEEILKKILIFLVVFTALSYIVFNKIQDLCVNIDDWHNSIFANLVKSEPLMIVHIYIKVILKTTSLARLSVAESDRTQEEVSNCF
jgi:hypothetical protein